MSVFGLTPFFLSTFLLLLPLTIVIGCVAFDANGQTEEDIIPTARFGRDGHLCRAGGTGALPFEVTLLDF